MAYLLMLMLALLASSHAGGGNAYLDREFARLDKVLRVRVVK